MRRWGLEKLPAPTQGDWDKTRQWGVEVEKLPAGIVETADNLKQILLDGSPKAVRRMVHLSWQHPGDVEKFVNAILSAGLSWDGEIDLTDKDSREWITKYSKADDWKTFGDLLPQPSATLGPPPELVSPIPVTDLDSDDEGPAMSEEELIKALFEKVHEERSSTLADVEKEFADKPNIVDGVKRRVAEAQKSSK